MIKRTNEILLQEHLDILNKEKRKIFLIIKKKKKTINKLKKRKKMPIVRTNIEMLSRYC
jgi:hypothetical protein